DPLARGPAARTAFEASAPHDARAPLRVLGEQALSRAAGAPLIAGNRVRLLRDAPENYAAWLDALEGARRSVHFEMYIFADDVAGRRFADALVACARRGVEVRLLLDWLGMLGEAGGAFRRRLADASVEVRTFNPFRFDSPLAWLRRNHRKTLVVDDRLGFVTGLCVADRWLGDPARGRPPWRDTGVELEGPAVPDLSAAFARAWAQSGPPLPESRLPDRGSVAPAGDVALRVVATEPSSAGNYRLDQLVAAVARERLWLTDAYFVGFPSYVEGLRAAARDGVDVRLLVPGRSDLGLVKRLGIAGYRPLLEGGVRVFEWNGPMLHAKTAVADRRWCRVGSSNLNLASWIGNWELDVAIEDDGFAASLAAAFEEDLENATEVVLGERRRPPGRALQLRGTREGSAVKTAGALRLGNVVGAALGGHRVLGRSEATALVLPGLALLAAAALFLLFPRAIAVPLAVVATWLGVSLLLAAA
ncbi:MAG TPA: phospholipase D-like domain-containing protein, partial [Anaeromyxobacteraceae bacterium]|nr:phospholipase D-like domain-containing protein [Anaeromyxobacteraceae bacterium]